MVHHRGIRFRQHAREGFAHDIIATVKRDGIWWYAAELRKTKQHGVLQEYLVRLQGVDIGRAMRALVAAGYDEDSRDPRVQEQLKDFKRGLEAGRLQLLKETGT